MAFRLRPHERGFYPLFTRAAENIADAARQLEAVPEARGQIAARIKEAETAGDGLTHEILVTLNSTFVTPFDREDIHRLASSLDDVLDALDEAADRIVLYRLGALMMTALLWPYAEAGRTGSTAVSVMPRQCPRWPWRWGTACGTPERPWA